MRCTISSTYSARYFPSKLTESVEIGFRRSLLYPILFQFVMSKTIVKISSPISSIKIQLKLFGGAILNFIEQITFYKCAKQERFLAIPGKAATLNLLIL
jgi:hypothetical protein